MTSLDDLDFDTDLVPATRPVSPGQMRFITDLRNQWQVMEDDLARLTNRQPVRPTWRDPADFAAASDMIEAGKAAKAAKRDELDTALVEGFYTDGEYFWRVKFSQTSGRPYALLFDDGEWTYDSKNIHDVTGLAHRASLAEAEAFGVRFGYCGICGRLLTNPESIARGIGPICAERF